MDTTLNHPITPAEAFAAAREALDAHEALLPALPEHLDPAIAESNRLVVSLLRDSLAAAEAVMDGHPTAGGAFGAGYTTGSIVQLVTAATAGLDKIVGR